MAMDKLSFMTRAKRLLSDPTPENLRYAALELRSCIEALTYEKLRSFSTVIPEDVLKTWQPPQAVKALLEFEPKADHSFEIRVARQDDEGKPVGEARSLGQHVALSFKWLRKHYHKLGNQLHAPSVGDSLPLDGPKLATYLTEVINDLQEPLNSTILGGGFREVYSFKCSKCEQLVVANVETVRQSERAVCLNAQCKAEYFARTSDDGEAIFELMVTVFECMKDGCIGAIPVENRLLDIGVEFSCPKCGSKHVVVERTWGYGLKAG